MLRYIRERTVSIVSIKPVLAEVGHEKIFVTVVVVVAHADSHGPSGVEQSCPFRYVRNCAVAIAVVKPVAGGGGNAFEKASSENENVHPTVVIVVEKSATTTHDFGQIGSM